MATTDPMHALWEALVSIAGADAGVAGVTGRATENLLPWEDVGTNPPLPGLAGKLLSAPEIGGVGVNWTVTIRFSAHAAGDGALRKVRELCSAWVAAVTQPALAARGVDALVLRVQRDEPPVDPEQTRALARADVTMDFWLTA